jgi:hypothetical protein
LKFEPVLNWVSTFEHANWYWYWSS